MKGFFVFLFAFALAPLAFAATNHTATVTYAASPDSTAQNPGTVQIYYQAAACPASGIGTGAWTLANGSAPPSAPSTAPLVITLPGPGIYCVYATATIGGAPSGPSNTAGGLAPPFPPSAVTVVIQ
jgi:hypothetical protein